VKVTRDRIMVGLHAELPQYGFDAHKGYCTPVHDAALAVHGPSRVHRYSFVNVRAAAGRGDGAAVGGVGTLLHNDGVHNEGEGVPDDDAPDAGGVQS
jgi:ribonuclease HII